MSSASIAGSAVYSDENLDKAGLHLLSRQESIDAKSEMSVKNYLRGTLGDTHSG